MLLLSVPMVEGQQGLRALATPTALVEPPTGSPPDENMGQPFMEPVGTPTVAKLATDVCSVESLDTCIQKCVEPFVDDVVPAAPSVAPVAPVAVPVTAPTLAPKPDPKGPKGLDMGSLCNFAILTKSGVTQTSSAINPTVVTGDVGTSPIAYTALTGFALVMSEKSTHMTSHIVKGNLYGANHAVPTPAMLTTAVLDMQAAHVDGMGRKFPDAIELGAGILEGYTLKPGLYKWATGIGWASKLTFEGGPDDVWILQVSGIITSASYSNVILQGGARAENIFWITTAAVFGTYSHLEGVFLASTAITFATGSSLNGAAFAQTAVTLDTANVLKETCGQSWSESDGGWKTEVAPLN